MKNIHIIGGGTVFHIRPHLAISAIAYGNTAKKIASICKKKFNSEKYRTVVHLTKMASNGRSHIETNDDVELCIKEICAEPQSAILFLPVALCDFKANILDNDIILESSKKQPRLRSRDKDYLLLLKKADKLIANVKKNRPDIILIGFKTTSNILEEETIKQAKQLLSETNCNLVFANDIHKKLNYVLAKDYISPPLSNRELALNQLIDYIIKLS